MTTCRKEKHQKRGTKGTGWKLRLTPVEKDDSARQSLIFHRQPAGLMRTTSTILF
jgi:hypothetical protein